MSFPIRPGDRHAHAQRPTSIATVIVSQKYTVCSPATSRRSWPATSAAIRPNPSAAPSHQPAVRDPERQKVTVAPGARQTRLR